MFCLVWIVLDVCISCCNCLISSLKVSSSFSDMDELGGGGNFSLRLLLFRALSLSMEAVGFFVLISTYVRLDFQGLISRPNFLGSFNNFQSGINVFNYSFLLNSVSESNKLFIYSGFCQSYTSFQGMLSKIVELISSSAFKLFNPKKTETFKLSLDGKKLTEHIQLHSNFLKFCKCYIQIHDKDENSTTFFSVLR